jgi:hypothetical protein
MILNLLRWNESVAEMKSEGGNAKRDNYFRCVRNNKLYNINAPPPILKLNQ